MKTAIITGISGQDGSYLASLLINKGYKVIGLTRSKNTIITDNLKYLDIFNEVIIEECDMTDIKIVTSLLKKYSPIEIYNLTAQSSVSVSFKQPIETISFNTISVLNILESIRLIDKNIKFYQAASSEMYGNVKDLPIKINSPMHPMSPYGISKASSFWTVNNYRESYNLFCCCGVLFNHESYLRSTNFFVKKVIFESITNLKNPNWVLKVGNLDIQRDFGYSPDYVEAMWMMLQQKYPNDFIICSGKSISLRSIVEYVFDKLNISHNKIFIDKLLFRPAEIINIYGNNDNANLILGWNYTKNFYEVLDILIEEEIKNQPKF